MRILEKPRLPSQAVAGIEAMRLGRKYSKNLQIKGLRESVRFYRKGLVLALCYEGFSFTRDPDEMKGAGKAAFLSCAYDVLTDWRRTDPKWRDIFEETLSILTSEELKLLALELFDKDQSGILENDGLERGKLAFEFILQMMEIRESMEERSRKAGMGIEEIGLRLQIADDVLDYESDRDSRQMNCLASINRSRHLQTLIDWTDEQRGILFRPQSILSRIVHIARKKAQRLLLEPN